MTAPDDLARTLAACLAKHRYEARDVNPDGRVGWLTCSCGWGKDATPPVRADLAVSIWESIHLAEHLASVVSRRDADLRTRDQMLRDWLAEVIDAANHMARALDGDTREVAPEQCGAPAGTCPHGVCRKKMGDPYGCGGCCACLGGCQERPDAPTTATSAPNLTPAQESARPKGIFEHYDNGSSRQVGWTADAPVDDILVEQIAQVLVYHQRRDIGSCICGWGVAHGNLGQSHAAHVARLVVEARPWQGEVEAARRDTPARSRRPADTDTGRGQ